MSPVPFFLRFVGGWQTIREHLAEECQLRNIPSADKEPNRYRYDGWGVMGFPPRVACNITYFPEHGDPFDLGRFPVR
ncbi:MAG: hypothetical protein AAGD09_11500 [Cyanobacteria bacterium P01_F01_bin.56]